MAQVAKMRNCAPRAGSAAKPERVPRVGSVEGITGRGQVANGFPVDEAISRVHRPVARGTTEMRENIIVFIHEGPGTRHTPRDTSYVPVTVPTVTIGVTHAETH